MGKFRILFNEFDDLVRTETHTLTPSTHRLAHTHANDHIPSIFTGTASPHANLGPDWGRRTLSGQPARQEGPAYHTHVKHKKYFVDIEVFRHSLEVPFLYIYILRNLKHGARQNLFLVFV